VTALRHGRPELAYWGDTMSVRGDNLAAQLQRLRDEYPGMYDCLDPVRVAHWQSTVTNRRHTTDEFGPRELGGRGESYVTAQARSVAARARGIRTLIEYMVADGQNSEGVFLDLLGGDGLVRRVASLIGFSHLQILTCDASPYMVEKAWGNGHPAVLQEAQRPLARTGSLSGVLLAYGTHHLAAETRMTVAREAHRMLKPGGIFVVHDFAHDSQAANWFRDIVDKFGHTGHQYEHFSHEEILGYLTGAGFEACDAVDIYDPFVMSGTSPAIAEGLLAAYLLDMYGLSKAVDLWGTAGARSWVLQRAREVFRTIPVRKVTEPGMPGGHPGHWTAELPRRALAGIGIKR
jgi:SAM-dependent methyltransferase